MTSQPAVDPGGGLAVAEPPKRLPRHPIHHGSGPAAAVVVGSFSANGIPAVALGAYRRAALAADRADRSCHLGWTLLAGIGRVESDHGQFGGAQLLADGLSTIPVIGPPLNGKGTALIRDTDNGRLDGDRTFDRAVGPMQFIPSTWAVWASDGDHDGRANPFDIDDASLAAARYLCAAGGDLAPHAGQVRAVLAYNHSMAYVRLVLAYAALYAGLNPGVIPPLPKTAPRPIGPTSTRGPQPPATTQPAGPGPTRHPTRAPSRSTHPAAPTATRSSPARAPSTSSTHPTASTSTTRPVTTTSTPTTTVASSPVTSTAGTPDCPTPTGTRTGSPSAGGSTATGATSTTSSSSAASTSASVSGGPSRPRHSKTASSSSAACAGASAPPAAPNTVSAGVTGITGLVACAFALLVGGTLVRRRLGGAARH
jgi:hypothetical protein